MTNNLADNQAVSSVLAEAARANWAPSRAPTGPEAALFAAIIGQAVADAQSDHPTIWGPAYGWLHSRSDGPCSFRWYCDQLDVSPRRILASIKARL